MEAGVSLSLLWHVHVLCLLAAAGLALPPLAALAGALTRLKELTQLKEEGNGAIKARWVTVQRL